MVKKLDMSWGNLSFLDDYWKNIDLKYNVNNVLNYLYPVNVIPVLEEHIRKLHDRYNNCNHDGKYILVGNGATQLLIAAMHVSGKKTVSAQSPYYTRFPSLAKIAGLDWTNSVDQAELEILTIPNNPDNSTDLYHPSKRQYIHDLSYNWPQYNSGWLVNEDIMIYSLSKATGHANTRLGWAVIKDRQTYEKMLNYIEMSSNGVSLDAQTKALYIIKNQFTEKVTVFDYAKIELNRRWDMINELILPFAILNRKDRGMFAWCYCNTSNLPENIEVMPGNLFGKDKNYFRLNLACDSKTWELFCERYAKQ